MSNLPSFRGVFEAHITVRQPVNLESFRQSCVELGVKPVLIQLAAGDTPTQPMTADLYQGDFADALHRTEAVAESLRARGFHVTRVKIEAGPDNHDLPQTDEETRSLSSAYYYEHHLKAIVESNQRYQELREISAEHEGHLSANAFNHREDSTSEYFITVRSYALGKINAEIRIEALLKHLERAEFEVTKRICEYCVYDSNPGVDNEWT